MLLKASGTECSGHVHTYRQRWFLMIGWLDFTPASTVDLNNVSNMVSSTKKKHFSYLLSRLHDHRMTSAPVCRQQSCECRQFYWLVVASDEWYEMISCTQVCIERVQDRKVLWSVGGAC